MGNDTELIWVDKEFAARWKELTSKKTEREQMDAVFEEYMRSVSDTIRRDFKANLESLEEDAAIFTGLMLKTRQAFEKAKNEHMEASEALWGKFDAEIPSVKTKVASIVDTLKPLHDMVKDIDSMFAKISTFNIEKALEMIGAVANAYGKQRVAIDFLVANFGKD